MAPLGRCSMDYDVAVYLGTLPKIQNHNLKVQIMRAFAEGAQAAGARVIVKEDRTLVRARLAVMIGWVGMNPSGPHIMFRQQIVQHQRDTGGRVMPIDGSCFKFTSQGDMWLRYSLDSVFYNTGFYANANSDAQSWIDIQRSLGVRLEPWRTQGNHILICLQRDGGWNSKGFDQTNWLRNTVKTIRKISNRPIVVRPHPAGKTDLGRIVGKDGITISPSKDRALDQDIRGAHAAVFFNSSSSVAAVLAGVPVFVDDDSAVTSAVANRNLDMIENPIMPGREQWLYDLAACHWTIDQSRRGDIWRHFVNYL